MNDRSPAGVTAVVVTYNSADTIGALLDSLAAGTIVPAVVVVDNGSRDETVAIVRARGDATVIATGANLGYSGGINVALRRIDAAEHVLILNPDLTVAPTTVAQLMAELGDGSVGLVAPLLRESETGTRFDSLRREPTPLRALGDAVFGSRWRSRPAWFGETLRRDEDYARPCDVDWAGGAALLVSAACRRAVGEWDADTFFLYAEETDYARRVRAAGFRVRFTPAAQAQHDGSGSGQPAALVALLSVNRVRDFARHHGTGRTALFRAAVAVQHALRPHDARHRHALPIVLDRRRWASLPAGEPLPERLSTPLETRTTW